MVEAWKKLYFIDEEIHGVYLCQKKNKQMRTLADTHISTKKVNEKKHNREVWNMEHVRTCCAI